jgi:hypothetical protein
MGKPLGKQPGGRGYRNGPYAMTMVVCIESVLNSSNRNTRLPPRLVLIGRCCETQQLFGVRVNLKSSVCQIFPLLIRGTDTHPLVVVHPYLHGYHGKEDYSCSTRQGIYAVPVSWGGQQVVTSYAVAWGLWADFKY